MKGEQKKKSVGVSEPYTSCSSRWSGEIGGEKRGNNSKKMCVGHPNSGEKKQRKRTGERILNSIKGPINKREKSRSESRKGTTQGRKQNKGTSRVRDKERG